ncbi:transglycosylase SLT domain-containing protein [Streptomyces cacaoi]|uniref:aggregation-promoting factor C-terminal-like domain-containing protein n=1 Tax=Streptomyces cacaoi TaxID=1898 RepID=UPI002614E07B|nr:transglycosylase SLT domain-containing protein [Streptomyces cacaoi]
MSAPSPGPSPHPPASHRGPRRFSRLQKVSAATGIAAVGVTALAFGTASSGGSSQDAHVAEPATGTQLVAVSRAAQQQHESIGRQSARMQQQLRQEKRAARKAAEKRAAAREKARAEREERAAKAAERERRSRAEASRSARRSATPGATASPRPAAPTGSPREIARQIIGDEAQFRCFSRIVERESGWNVTAQNPSSGAYGLVQALPGTKMPSAGADWRTNPATQIKWGLGYMKETYGSPCGAWSFWQSHQAY